MQELTALTLYEKYTLFFYNDFGFPCVLPVRMYGVEVREYAQYPEAAFLQYIPKGKRRLVEQIITPRQKVAIWPGWLDVDADMFVSLEKSEATGCTVRRTLRCFSPEYLARALASVTEKPFILREGN